MIPHNPDPATTDTDYLVADERVMVHKSSQVVTLQRPAYKSTLEVYALDELGDPTLLVADTDYTVGVNDADAISAVLLEEDDPSSWDYDLITQITIIASFTSVYQLSVVYTSSAMDASAYVAEGASGPEPTQALMADMLADISTLQFTNSPITSATAIVLDGVRLLEEDLTGVNDDNLITDEQHFVTTASGVSVIRPQCGAFYQHDFVIRDPNGITMVENTDYQFLGLNVDRTRATSHTSGVFYGIAVTKAVSGTCTITYRAFGGEMTRADAVAMKDAVQSLLYYVQSNPFLTVPALEETDIVNDIRANIHTLRTRQDYMWLKYGAYASYTVTAADTDYHWLTIAKLYMDDEEENLVTKDIGVFRIYGVTNLDIDLTFQVQFEKSATGNDLQIKTLYGVNGVKVIPGMDYTEIENQIVPRVRAIYDSNDAGILLQVAIPIDTAATVIVDNYSTPLAAWTLPASGTVVHGDADDNVSLPDAINTWVDGVDSKVERSVGYSDGLVVFGGGCPLVETEMTLFSPLLGGVVPATDVEYVEVGVYDRHTGSVVVGHGYTRPVTSDMNMVHETAVVAGIMFYVADMCAVEVTISAAAADDPAQIVVTPFIGSKSLVDDLEADLHRFQLNHVKLFYRGESS